VPCTRFPTPTKRGAGATDHSDDFHVAKTIIMVLAIVALCIVASTIEGGWPMIASFVVHLAVHFVIVVGSRVEGIVAQN
jgi:hypothetical protein